jgi:hypothetical protein
VMAAILRPADCSGLDAHQVCGWQAPLTSACASDREPTPSKRPLRKRLRRFASGVPLVEATVGRFGGYLILPARLASVSGAITTWTGWWVDEFVPQAKSCSAIERGECTMTPPNARP